MTTRIDHSFPRFCIDSAKTAFLQVVWPMGSIEHSCLIYEIIGSMGSIQHPCSIYELWRREQDQRQLVSTAFKHTYGAHPCDNELWLSKSIFLLSNKCLAGGHFYQQLGHRGLHCLAPKRKWARGLVR